MGHGSAETGSPTNFALTSFTAWNSAHQRSRKVTPSPSPIANATRFDHIHDSWFSRIWFRHCKHKSHHSKKNLVLEGWIKILWRTKPLHQARFSCTYIRHDFHIRGTWFSHCERFKTQLLNWLEEDNYSLGANEQILLTTRYDIQLHLQPAMEWLQNRISASASGIRSRFYRGPIEVQKNHAPFLPKGNPAPSRPQQQQAARRIQQQHAEPSSKQKVASRKRRRQQRQR